MTSHTDSRRVPGWERVLDAFAAAPDRILTNAELGMIPGVQAFHQRITDLERLGYVLTSAVQLKPGYYAYALVGRAPRLTDVPAPGGTRPAPHVASLPVVGDHHEVYGAAIARAVASINAKRDALLKRTAPSVAIEVIAAHHRVIRDIAATLREAIDPERLGAIDEASRDDGLVLAHAARHEIADLHGKLADALGQVAELEAARPARAARAPRADRGPTGPQLMRKALEHHEQPMHSAKIAAWVMANGGDQVFKGKTPAASMASQLATSNKDDGEFVRVDTAGCFGLREWEGKQDDFGNDLLDLDPIR